MSSFAAKRQGRSRPNDISFSRRKSHEDKPWPSPSFNSSMSLKKVDDVFLDSMRSVDRLRNAYLAMPSTPSSMGKPSSPNSRKDRLPSLSDLFDSKILSPITPGFQTNFPASNQSSQLPRRSSSSSSSSSPNYAQYWSSSFQGTAVSSWIGPPATPLSPYFGSDDKTPVLSPRSTFSDQHKQYSAMGQRNDSDMTPKAISIPAFETGDRDNGSTVSPTCPGAPLIGTQTRGHFETPPWSARSDRTPVGSFGSDGAARLSSHCSPDMSVGSMLLDSDELIRLENRMPKGEGLVGLGIHLGVNPSPIVKDADITTVRTRQKYAGKVNSSPLEKASHVFSADAHTGLTPLIKSSKMSDSASTPTKIRSPVPSRTSKAQLHQDCTVSSPSTTAKRAEPLKTPLKSRPMFRLDTGSSRKSSRPKGHKMSPNSSFWGVIGVKDGWKPLAPPNVSRAFNEATKELSQKIESQPERGDMPAPQGKRESRGASDASSPIKRHRIAAEAPPASCSSPLKENIVARSRSSSPRKRLQTVSPSCCNSPTARPLSTVR